ncbi:MAG: universal stress protein [Nitrospiraceae bacterium]|nr:MAG: universal stress protein [Nitrospiraceae bacterium]
MKIERILFPTDFSEGSSYALPYAVDLTRHYNAKLYILHVVYDIKQATGVHIPHISSDEVFRELNEWAVKEISSCYVEEVRGLPQVEKKVVKGIPAEEILNFARDEKIDIIVMGTYGRVGLQRLIFGNTAERVVRTAPCPVMTVKIPEHRKA